jgi:twitching motility protein PilT
MAAEVETFLDYALEVGASDLILAEGLVPAVRILSRVCAIPEAPALKFGDLEKLTGVLNGESGSFRGGPWGGRLWCVRYSREAFGKMAMFRPILGECPDFAAIGAPDAVSGLLRLDTGLVLFAGPADSGKTTTASSFVSGICKKRICRARFLDPVPEYDIAPGESLVHYKRAKVSVEQEIAQGIAAGTDVFWLGDISQKTVLPMLRAAEAGSLVIGCMTAGNAVGVLDHLFAGQTPANDALCRTLFASNLKAIISQKLIPAADGKSLGCTWEILFNNQGVASCIRSGEHFRIPSLIQAGAPEGMMPFMLSPGA